MPVGRNDPCPCGSGRKYKHCCLAGSELTEARWRAWREAEGTAVRAVLEFAGDVWGEEFLAAAFKEFFAGSPEPDDPRAHGTWEQLFLPWLAFDYVAGPRRRTGQAATWPRTVLAEEYLRQHGAHLPAVEVRVLRAGIEAPLSFMAVTAVQPGQAVDLKDILTGEAHHVIERSASSGLKPGHVVLARVLADGDIIILSGMGPFPLFPDAQMDVIGYREAWLRPRGPVNRERVRAASREILALYHRLVHRALHPKPPQMRNTDGDRLEPTTLEFELRCAVREAFERLKVLSVFRSEDDLLDDAERSPSGELTKVELEWSKKGNKLHRDWDNTTLGHVTLSAGGISVSVNSTKRAKKIRELIEKQLGPDVLYLRQTVESVDAMLDPSRRHDPDEAAQPEAPSIASTPEGRAFLDEMNRRHWQAWLDEKVPALGNVTPRRAAKTPLGRERLEALLAEFSWRQDASPRNLISVDVDWIRRELGLMRE